MVFRYSDWDEGLGTASVNVLPDVLWDVSKLATAVNSLWEKNSFSEGADVKGILFLFFWLKRGTDRKPNAEEKLKYVNFGTWKMF